MSISTLNLPTLRRWDRILGLNARNELIARRNTPAAVRLVNDKVATKVALAAHGVPVADTLLVLDSRRALAQVRWDALPDAFALKPSQSLGGSGILLAARRSPSGDGWESASGRHLPLRQVREHVRCILDGEYSPRGRDVAFLEPLIRAHPVLDALSYRGLPDIRVICGRPAGERDAAPAYRGERWPREPAPACDWCGRRPEHG